MAAYPDRNYQREKEGAHREECTVVVDEGAVVCSLVVRPRKLDETTQGVNFVLGDSWVVIISVARSRNIYLALEYRLIIDRAARR